MSSMMFVKVKKVLLLYLLVALIGAVQGYTTAGTHFVLAVPKVIGDQPGTVTVHMSTHEWISHVLITKPVSIHANMTKWAHEKTIILKRFISFTYILDKKLVLEANGIYATAFIQASAAIRAYLRVIDLSKFHFDIIELIPKRSCHYMYYLSTIRGNPFFAISAFDNETTVIATFPRFRNYFSVEFGGDHSCSPGHNVTTVLQKYNTWFFTLPGKFESFHNTIIRADSPIFVMTGNTLCTFGNFSDACITSAQPKTAWGKIYAVPNFADPRKAEMGILTLHFNVDRCPFRYTLASGNLESRKTLKDLQSPVRYYVTDPVIIAAEIPFALTLYFGVMGHGFVSSVQLTALGQWTRGVVWVIQNVGKEEDVNTFVFSTTDKVILPDFTGKIQWGRQNLHGTMYYSTRLEFMPGTQRIFTLEPHARLTVYLHVTTHRDTAGLWTVDSHRGEINHIHCTAIPPTDGDGVDNDCDGSIDEELRNDLDDDVDGRVDEDTVLLLGESEWMEWRDACVIQCHGKDVMRKVRSCKLGQFSKDCVGGNEVCSPGPICPRTCSGRKLQQTCNCSKGCLECNKQSSRCGECKAGYAPSYDCSLPCPLGWGGVGCADLNKPPEKSVFHEIESIVYDDKDYSDNIYQWEQTLDSLHDVQQNNSTGEGTMISLLEKTKDWNDRSASTIFTGPVIFVLIAVVLAIVILLALYKRLSSEIESSDTSKQEEAVEETPSIDLDKSDHTSLNVEVNEQVVMPSDADLTADQTVSSESRYH